MNPYCIAAFALLLSLPEPAYPQAGAMGQIDRIISERSSSRAAQLQSDSIHARLVQYRLNIRKTRGTLRNATYQRSGKFLLTLLETDQLLVWDLGNGGLAFEMPVRDGTVPVLFDQRNGEAFFLSRQRLSGGRFGPGGVVVVEEVAAGVGPVGAAIAGADGASIIAGLQSGAVVWMNLRGEIVRRIQIGTLAVSGIAMSNDGATLCVIDSAQTARQIAADGTVSDLGRVTRLVGYDESSLACLAIVGGTLTAFGRSGMARQEKAGGREVAQIATVGAKPNRLVQSEAGELRLSRVGAETLIDADVAHVAFMDDSRYVYVKTNGVFYVRHVERPEYLLTVVPGASGWIAVDHEGRLDGTIAGTNDVVWDAGGEAVSLDQFFDSFFQPGLLGAYLRDEQPSLTKTQSVPMQGAFLPPTVELQFPEGDPKLGNEFRVTVLAESRGDDFSGPARFFHNGKRLPAKARIGTQTVRKDGRLVRVEVFALTVAAGINEFQAEVGSSNGIAGRSETKRRNVAGPPANKTLSVLAVGINEYRNVRDPRENLLYAVADAKAILDAVGPNAEKLYRAKQSNLLIDRGATREAILASLAKLEQASPDDAVIVVLVGHGLVLDNEWYFAPHDIQSSAVESAKATSVSAREIEALLVNSPARQILVVIDSCHSGAGIDSFNRYKNFQRRFAQQIGRSAGVTLVAAARRGQGALEFQQFGHGLFTHTLLQGLDGAADTAPKDNQLSAHELARYVVENLKQKSLALSDSNGVAQEPQLFLIGADFVVADVHHR